MRKVKQLHGGEMQIMEKGETLNPNGRPRKFISTLKAAGYSRSEAEDCALVMLSMTIPELKAAFENPQATALEKAIAGAIRKDIEKGSLWNINSLLDRIFGKAAERLDLTTKGEKLITAIQINHVHITKEELDKATNESA